VPANTPSEQHFNGLTPKEAELLALVKRYATECAECNGTGETDLCCEKNPGPEAECCGEPVRGPCPDCLDIREAIAKAEGRS
jgi:hypothetical protein